MRVVGVLLNVAVTRALSVRVGHNKEASRRANSFATSCKVIIFPDPTGHSTLSASP